MTSLNANADAGVGNGALAGNDIAPTPAVIKKKSSSSNKHGMPNSALGQIGGS